MEKKHIKIAAVIILLTLACTGFWFMPVKPLKSAAPDEITSIRIDRPGMENITDPEIVRTIAENLYSCGAKRSGISFGRMGSVYDIYLYKGDTCVSRFSLCADDLARDSVFFYSPRTGTYCKEYIDNLQLPESETKS